MTVIASWQCDVCAFIQATENERSPKGWKRVSLYLPTNGADEARTINWDHVCSDCVKKMDAHWLRPPNWEVKKKEKKK